MEGKCDMGMLKDVGQDKANKDFTHCYDEAHGKYVQDWNHAGETPPNPERLPLEPAPFATK